MSSGVPFEPLSGSLHTSNKTRIETIVDSESPSNSEIVLYIHPIKQGLKLVQHGTEVLDNYRSLHTSNKTRIETRLQF